MKFAWSDGDMYPNDIPNKMCVIFMHPANMATEWMGRGRVGIAQFNLATPGGNNPEVRPITAYILPYNLKTKSNQNCFQRGARLHLNGFWLKIILRI